MNLGKYDCLIKTKLGDNFIVIHPPSDFCPVLRLLICSNANKHRLTAGVTMTLLR